MSLSMTGGEAPVSARRVRRFELGAMSMGLALAAGCAPSPSPEPPSALASSPVLVSAALALDVPALGIPDAQQLNPDIAWNGTHFLVVWADDRATSAHLEDDIYAARVTPEGEVLDPGGILVSSAPGEQAFPEVASDGTDFYVVWEDHREVAADVYGARVTAQGEALDGDGVLLSSTSMFQPAITFDGTSYVVVWEDFGAGNANHDLRGTRVSPEGAILDPTGFVVSSAPGHQSNPAIVSTGGESFVAWIDERSGTKEVYGARLDTSGNVLDPAGIFVGAAELAALVDKRVGPAVGTNGDSYLVAWVSAAPERDPVAARITLAGDVLDTVPIKLHSNQDAESRPAVASDGDAFLVAWHDGFRVRTRRVDAAGSLLETVPLDDLGNDPTYPAAEFGGGTYLTVSSDQSGFTARPLRGRLVSPGGVAAPEEITIGTAPAEQKEPAGTFDGSNYLALWTDTRGALSGTGKEVYGIHVSPAGATLEPAAFAVAESAAQEDFASAASNGTISLVGWAGTVGQGPRVTRVGPDGALLDPTPIQVSSTGVVNDIASDGDGFLVLWTQVSQTFVSRVDAAGNVLDPAGLLLPIAGERVVFDGTSYVVTGGEPLRSARVAQDGTLLDPSGNDLPFNGTVYEHETASAGSGTLLVWTDVAPDKVLGMLIGPDGLALGAGPVEIWSDDTLTLGRADVGFDGEGYLVAWLRDDKDTDTTSAFGAYLSSDGLLVGASGFVISDVPTHASRIAVIGGTGGQSLVLISRFDPASGSIRVEGRLVSRDTGGVCVTGTDCDTGFCVDGVCCNTPCSGGDPADCVACSVAAGAMEDGVCAPIADGTACDGGTCQSGVCAGEGGGGAGGTSSAGGGGTGGTTGGEGGTGNTGNGGTGGAGATGGGGAGGTDRPADEGCGCGVPGNAPTHGWLSALLGLIPLLARRRRASFDKHPR